MSESQETIGGIHFCTPQENPFKDIHFFIQAVISFDKLVDIPELDIFTTKVQQI